MAATSVGACVRTVGNQRLPCLTDWPETGRGSFLQALLRRGCDERLLRRTPSEPETETAMQQFGAQCQVTASHQYAPKGYAGLACRSCTMADLRTRGFQAAVNPVSQLRAQGLA